MLGEEELKSAILVVLANKQDMEGALSVSEVYQALGLEQLKSVFLFFLVDMVTNFCVCVGLEHFKFSKYPR